MDDASEDTKLVCVADAGNDAEAAMLRAYLESHDIYVYTQGENHHSLFGQLGGFIQLRLMVPANQSDTARGLIEAFRADIASEEPAEDEDEGEGEGRDEVADAEWRDAEERKQVIRSARVAVFFVPGSGGHFATGAWVRGLMLISLLFWSLSMGVGGQPAYFFLAIAIPVFDWLMVPTLVDARHARKLAAAALPRAHIAPTPQDSAP
ncbi:MAG: hypothetical protein Tsb0020_16620 [Haliangiales bacterium]